MDHSCLRSDPFDIGTVHHNSGAVGYGLAVSLEDPEGNAIELNGPADEVSSASHHS